MKPWIPGVTRMRDDSGRSVMVCSKCRKPTMEEYGFDFRFDLRGATGSIGMGLCRNCQAKAHKFVRELLDFVGGVADE